MSYLVLARKYRPQTVCRGDRPVTCNPDNRQCVRPRSRTSRISSFVVRGELAKPPLRAYLGKALNCEQGPTAAPCGKCIACESITAGTAVDYFEMDGASNRGIDSIRELTEAVRYQPAVLRKKVYVIDEVHMLTTEAFNALLKTLEEPPAHVTFVMATTEAHKLPNTILSRCQRYDFKLVPTPVLRDHLTSIFAAEEIAVEAGALSIIARESGGSVRDALSLCDQTISFVGKPPITESIVADVLGVADRTLTRTLVQALAESDPGGALACVDTAIQRGIHETQLARAIVRFLRDLAVAKIDANLVEGVPEEQKELANIAQTIDSPRLHHMFHRMMRACDDLGQTQNPRLVFDLALIEVATSEPLVPIGELLGRLQKLERQLRLGTPAGGGSPNSGPTRSPEQASMIRGDGSSRSGLSKAVSRGSSGKEPSSPLTRWEFILTELGKNPSRLPFVRIYESAKLLALSEESIEVGYGSDLLDAEIAVAPDRVEKMKEFLEEHFGRPIGFSVRLLSSSELSPGKVMSALEAAQKRDVADRTAREAEARTHPLTQKVLEMFQVEIQEINTDG